MVALPDDDAIREVFRRTQVPGPRWEHIYVLGTFVKGASVFSRQPRVTLFSQQARALNLVYALVRRQVLKPGNWLCVVGGGVAGLTAAAAAAHHECNVVLLESMSHLLPLLHNSTRRWLHPHLYEWPEPGSDNHEAGLPLINWRAATAKNVFNQIDVAFRECQERHGRIRPEVNVRDVQFKRIGAEWEVRWNGGAGFGRFAAVILAVGFGTEQTIDGVQHLSYWDNDNLDREDTRQDVQHIHHFISGCGDGGLTDFIRIRLRQFDHEDTFREFLRIAPASKMRHLKDFEHEAGGDAGQLAALYHRMKVSEIDSWIRSRLRPRTSATLHSNDPYPYSTKASSLNRFLVSRILKMDHGVGAVHKPGKIVPPVQSVGTKLQVVLENTEGKRVKALFDTVTIRHGVKPALEALNPEIYAACQSLPAGEEPDPTRTPLWIPHDFFGEVPPINGKWDAPKQNAEPPSIVPAGVDGMQQAVVPHFESLDPPPNGGAGSDVHTSVPDTPLEKLGPPPDGEAGPDRPVKAPSVEVAPIVDRQPRSNPGVKAAFLPIGFVALVIYLIKVAAFDDVSLPRDASLNDGASQPDDASLKPLPPQPLPPVPCPPWHEDYEQAQLKQNSDSIHRVSVKDTKRRSKFVCPPDKTCIAVADLGASESYKPSKYGREISELTRRRIIDRLYEYKQADTVIVEIGIVKDAKIARDMLITNGFSLILWGWIPDHANSMIIPNFTVPQKSRSFLKNTHLDVLAIASRQPRREGSEANAQAQELDGHSKQLADRTVVVTALFHALERHAQNRHPESIFYASVADDILSTLQKQSSEQDKVALARVRAVLLSLKGSSAKATGRPACMSADAGRVSNYADDLIQLAGILAGINVQSRNQGEEEEEEEELFWTEDGFDRQLDAWASGEEEEEEEWEGVLSYKESLAVVAEFRHHTSHAYARVEHGTFQKISFYETLRLKNETNLQSELSKIKNTSLIDWMIRPKHQQGIEYRDSMLSLIELHQQSPDKVWPICAMDLPDPRSAAIAEGCIRRGGKAIGVVWFDHPRFQSLISPASYALYSLAKRYSVPVYLNIYTDYTHYSDFDPYIGKGKDIEKAWKELGNLLLDFPDVQFIIPYFCGCFHLLTECAPLLNTHSNLHCGVGMGEWYRLLLAEVVKRGETIRKFFLTYQDRLLWGMEKEYGDFQMNLLEGGRLVAAKHFVPDALVRVSPKAFEADDLRFLGLSLPAAVLRKIYSENIIRLTGSTFSARQPE